MKLPKTLLLRKSSCVILTMEETNESISRISKNTNITFSHITQHIFPLMTKNNLIRVEKEGRNKKIFLTKKGKKIQILLKKIVTELYNNS